MSNSYVQGEFDVSDVMSHIVYIIYNTLIANHETCGFQ